jgi:hypothetical protein
MKKFIRKIELSILKWICTRYNLHTEQSVRQHQFATAVAANDQVREYIKAREEGKFGCDVSGPINKDLLDVVRLNKPHMLNHIGPSSLKGWDVPPQVTSYPHQKLGNW